MHDKRRRLVGTDSDSGEVSLFDGTGGPEGGDVVVVEVALAVGVLVDVRQAEACAELAADLLVDAVGELHPPAVLP